MPIYPPTLTEAPLNLHTHGLHVSPSGNADNVLLSIPAGHGQHLHLRRAEEHAQRAVLVPQPPPHDDGTADLRRPGRPAWRSAGPTAICRSSRRTTFPCATWRFSTTTSSTATATGHQLNNYSWPQWVSTLKPPEGTSWRTAPIEPSLAPVNIAETTMGAQYITPWWAGPAVAAQQPRPDPVHAVEPDRASTARPRRSPENPVAAGESARRAVHRQRPVPAGAEDQAGSDGDLGGGQHQRHRLHDSPIDRDRHRATIRSSPSSDRTATPTRRSDGPSTVTARRSSIPPAIAVRDRGHDAQARRPGPGVPAGSASAKPISESRCAVHEQRHQEPAGGARHAAPWTRSTSATPTGSSCSPPRP